MELEEGEEKEKKNNQKQNKKNKIKSRIAEISSECNPIMDARTVTTLSSNIAKTFGGKHMFSFVHILIIAVVTTTIIII